MGVAQPKTDPAQVDEFELQLGELIEQFGLVHAAQLPAYTIAHILRHTYDHLTKNRVDWDEVLGGKP